MYLIDANCFIYHNKDLQPHFSDWLEKIHDRDIYLSSLVYLEIVQGYLFRNNQKLLRVAKGMWENYNSLNYTPEDAFLTAKIKTELFKKSIQNETYDLLIAAQAINNNLSLVTFNKKDFLNIPNLKAKYFTYQRNEKS